MTTEATYHFRTAAPGDAEKIEAFNRRLRAGGELAHKLSLEAPFKNIKLRPGCPIAVEKFVITQDDEIRGGVSIKRMQFRIRGAPSTVATWVYPVSEGLVNSHHALIALRIHRETLRRYPLMYASGAPHSPNARLMRAAGWQEIPIPFHFIIFHAFQFFRNIAHLRQNTVQRVLLDIAAFTGIGSGVLAGIRVFYRLRRLKKRPAHIALEPFERWGGWADDVWQKSRDAYNLIGDRSCAALQALYSEDNKKLLKLRVIDRTTDQTLGWAVLTVSKGNDHKYFGNLIFATLVDMLAHPKDAYAVASLAILAARRSGADLFMVNHSSKHWNSTFKQLGMFEAKTRLHLFLSPKLAKYCQEVGSSIDEVFFTQGDGHGPARFWRNR